MKLIALGFLILIVAPQIIGQETVHGFASTGLGNIQFSATTMERQDPPGAPSDAYASIVHLKGNVLIRACCIRKGTADNQPPQVILMRGEEAVVHQDTNEIEFRGNARLTFQNEH